MREDNLNENNNVDIEIVIGDDSDLEISDAKDCVNSLRPKNTESQKKKIIIPKSKK